MAIVYVRSEHRTGRSPVELVQLFRTPSQNDATLFKKDDQTACLVRWVNTWFPTLAAMVGAACVSTGPSARGVSSVPTTGVEDAREAEGACRRTSLAVDEGLHTERLSQNAGN